MYCHSTPPIPGWHPNRPSHQPMPVDELPFPPELDPPPPDPQIPEPAEYGPPPHVVLH
jgi:hypothetical protein